MTDQIATVDVAVVGAGPAGSAAAITLARAGRRVALIDKARFPRDKCCGDGLTTAALHRLEGLGLDPASVPSWQPVGEVFVRAPGGRQACFPFPQGQGTFGVVARRAELDAALVELARAAGADVVTGVACASATRRDDRVVLGLADGRAVHARYVVGADGMWSPLRRLLGLATAGYRGEWHAVRQYFHGVGPRAARELHVWFEPDFLPGYAWSFPLPDGRANVGLGIQRGGSYQIGDLKHLWPELLARPHVRAVLGEGAQPEAPHRAWPIPARIDDVALADGRVLFVGDAAAATDPMTGEGIGQALATGTWAAEAITAAGPDRPEVARRRYEAAVRHDLVPDHHMATGLMRVLAHAAGTDASVRVAAATPWTRERFARWLFEDEPRAIVATPRRWHRSFLARPGAYADLSASWTGPRARLSSPTP